MKGFTMIVLVAFIALSSALPNNSGSVTKTDDVQGLGEFQFMQALSGPNCYTCSAPCAVAGKGCCSGTRFPQCRQIDGVACRCTQF